MATNTKIVLMDPADDWNPRTVDKLNYDLKSLKLGIDAALSKLESNDYPENEHGIPTGGNQNQVLAKASAADYDVHWVNQSGGGGTQVQSDWTQTDTNEPSYIQHKPENLVQDADYVHTANNYTDIDKSKLDGIAAGAEVNVQADWNVTDNTSDAFINHKPTIPTKTSDLTNDSGFVESSDLATVATTGDYDDLIDTPNLASVATSGSYNDLSNTPTIPEPAGVNDTPAMDATASVGSSLKYAKADHVHPSDTSKQAALVSGTNIKTIGGTSVLGSGDIKVACGLSTGVGDSAININLDNGSTTYPDYAQISASDIQADWNETNSSYFGYINNKPSIPEAAGNSDTPAMDGTGAVGQSTKYAKADHVHPTDTGRAAASHTHGSITNDGKISGTAVSIASGNHLVITNNNNEIKMGGLFFSSDTTQFLRHDGNWATPSGGGSTGGTGAWSGYCNTSESTSDKTIITEGDITVALGASLYVDMRQPNSLENGAGAITFKIGNLGVSYPVYVNWSSTSAQNRLTWATDDILEFVFFDFGLLGGFGWEYIGGSSTMPIKGTYSYNNLSDKPAVPSVASTSTLLAGDGAGNAIAVDPSLMFVVEAYPVINGVSVASGAVAEANGYQITKSGYYPIAIAGWTSGNRYPTVFGCRLMEQNVGSGTLYCGAANWTGATRTFTVNVRVLWVLCDGTLQNMNGVDF